MDLVCVLSSVYRSSLWREDGMRSMWNGSELDSSTDVDNSVRLQVHTEYENMKIQIASFTSRIMHFKR